MWNKFKNKLFKKSSSLANLKNNNLVCYRCYDGKITRIEPVINPSTIHFSNNLFQEAGYVNFEGLTFDLRLDGVYRFYRLPEISEQRIVCKDGLFSLLKMLGYLWQYGNKDDDLTSDQLLQKLGERTLVLGCNSLSELSQQILNYYEIKSRLVACITCDPWNAQDDGHTLLEIKDENHQWFVYDPSFQRYFSKTSIFDLCIKR